MNLGTFLSILLQYCNIITIHYFDSLFYLRNRYAVLRRFSVESSKSYILTSLCPHYGLLPTLIIDYFEGGTDFSLRTGIFLNPSASAAYFGDRSVYFLLGKSRSLLALTSGVFGTLTSRSSGVL